MCFSRQAVTDSIKVATDSLQEPTNASSNGTIADHLHQQHIAGQ